LSSPASTSGLPEALAGLRSAAAYPHAVRMRHFEPVTTDEQLPRTLVDTDAVGAIDGLIAVLA
jgi:hypothetical protein